MPRSPSGITGRCFQVGVLLALLCVGSARPSAALDTLFVGGVRRPWTVAKYSSQYVGVSADSVWMWPVTANANVCLGTLERGGDAWLLTSTYPVRLPEARALFDGDAGTAYDPDSTRLASRGSAFVLDLGGTFTVNRVRCYPRLDQRHLLAFLQTFSLYTADDLGGEIPAMGAQLLSYIPSLPNAAPLVDRFFAPRSLRYLIVSPDATRPWELAEIELFSDGTMPVGEYVSKPLTAAANGNQVWGKVRIDRVPVELLPVTVATRTGPDPNPVLYYRRLVQGVDEFEVVDEATYSELTDWEKGPTKPNPAWSGWETVADGMVRSPGLRPYVQVRVRLAKPGMALHRLTLEYATPPLARSLTAEVNPEATEPGEETRFVLSVVAYLRTTGTQKLRDTGFRQLEVVTDAEVTAVDSILVDDLPVFASTTVTPGRGFSVNLWRRVEQNGSFLQAIFRAKVFRDQTRFQVTAIDRRTGVSGLEDAYQLCEEGDVDVDLPGRGLVVSLIRGGKGVPVLGKVTAATAFSPNGDGVNDRWTLSLMLLKLVAPARVSLDLFDLSGRSVGQAWSEELTAGEATLSWDGRDQAGELVPPGIYLYRVRVEADQGATEKEGTVGVVY